MMFTWTANDDTEISGCLGDHFGVKVSFDGAVSSLEHICYVKINNLF